MAVAAGVHMASWILCIMRVLRPAGGAIAAPFHATISLIAPHSTVFSLTLSLQEAGVMYDGNPGRRGA